MLAGWAIRPIRTCPLYQLTFASSRSSGPLANPGTKTCAQSLLLVQVPVRWRSFVPCTDGQGTQHLLEYPRAAGASFQPLTRGKLEWERWRRLRRLAKVVAIIEKQVEINAPISGGTISVMYSRTRIDCVISATIERRMQRRKALGYCALVAILPQRSQLLSRQRRKNRTTNPR